MVRRAVRIRLVIVLKISGVKELLINTNGQLGSMKESWKRRIDGYKAHASYAGMHCVVLVILGKGSLTIRNSNGCGMDVGVKGEGKEARIVGVRGRAVDRVNHGRLGPKGNVFPF